MEKCNRFWPLPYTSSGIIVGQLYTVQTKAGEDTLHNGGTSEAYRLSYR